MHQGVEWFQQRSERPRRNRRAVRVTGFLALDHAGRPYLVRMALNCCAADAQPVKIALTGALPPVLRPDAWLEVTARTPPGSPTTRSTTAPSPT
ncbi:hypothetical protein GCM10010300_44810 [Streptomyces olivaceoviridis]|nr:hypothetical protein GCM10010300_44810 [Streptomyces olivaceoviridis]